MPKVVREERRALLGHRQAKLAQLRAPARALDVPAEAGLGTARAARVDGGLLLHRIGVKALVDKLDDQIGPRPCNNAAVKSLHGTRQMRFRDDSTFDLARGGKKPGRRLGGLFVNVGHQNVKYGPRFMLC